jgi:flagellar biosynthetic protein FlhB
MAENKTEKATPKKRQEARQKGQVARSMDANGAVVLMASVLALSAFGPAMLHRMQEATLGVLAWIETPDVVDRKGVGELFMTVGMHVAVAAMPVIAICTLAGIVVNVGQVGFKPSPKALAPDFKKLNPLTGAKNIFGMNAIFESVKNVLKIGAVGAIVALAVFPKLEEMAALVGMPAQQLLPHLAGLILRVAQWGALAYLVIAAADYIYQRHRFEKNLKMDKEEVKREHKQQELPAEVKGTQRRRAMELARARMMDAVPTADVVVTNPTHFSVALKYDADNPAPVVVAKGTDHLALRIRREAAAHGVAVVPDPPLARALYASVEVGRMIPEELFQGVAQLLAYVYKVAGQRAAVA